MIDEILIRIFFNQWAVLFIVSLLLLAFSEAGYRLGILSHRENAHAAEAIGGNVQGAVLGLLGLLLGFSFAMSVGRYDARLALVNAEANSIGTTWLRADFLPSPQREEIRGLLVRYTRLRIQGFSMAGNDKELALQRKETWAIHNQLWASGASAANLNPTPLSAAFISSLNETIDLDATRVAALRNHVPGAVWLLLLVVSGCGAWASGYSSGTNGTRSLFNQFVFPLLIAVVITLTADIDRPTKGLIGLSQKPLEDLLQNVQSTKP
jgi:hypothetical protein